MKKNLSRLKTAAFVFAAFSLLAVSTNGCGNHEEGKCPPSDSATAVTGRFFTLSDVHFNPFYDSLIVMKLVQADVSGWEAVFQSSQLKTVGVYGKDSDYGLMMAAFAAMKNVNANPDFIVITGDFLGHDFQADYAHYTGIDNTDSLNNFITKTTQFIAMELGKQFPNVPVYPVLGNNDAFCGDYMIQPDNGFLKVFEQTWAPFLDSVKGMNTMAKTFPSGGYYAASLPGFPDHVIIGLNTIFFSPKDIGGCGSFDTTYGHVEMKWLEEMLASCEKQNKKAWITCHIPPGGDVYSSLNHMGKPDCEQHLKMMWKAEYDSAFIALENKYKNTITGGLGGHTHMDEFRLIDDASGNPISFFHINPSISPIDGNNPGFQLFTYDPKGMMMLDYKSYVFQGIQNPSNMTWPEEYDFNTTYNQKELTGATMGNTWTNFYSDSISRSKYLLYYANSAPLVDQSQWRAYMCCIGNAGNATYAKCICSGIK